MINRIDTAVILAAGLGSRLGDLKDGKPKAFLEIEGISLIERSIEALRSRGIQRIIIGTGYENHHFDNLADKYEQVITRRNERFDSTGSMYTLFLLKDMVTQPFLLLEGDLLYEPAALDYLLDDGHDEIILASTATHSGDEVFIEASHEGMLLNMSKNRDALNAIAGELVGISKLSVAGLQSMCQFAQQRYDAQHYGIHYEDAMVGASASSDFFVKVVDDLAWCEIDDHAHLERAMNSVYPKIKERSKL
ncbi:MAG: phosphocholine cytidylyltransferase family protein [Cyclobacteriaceae bacterium]